MKTQFMIGKNERCRISIERLLIRLVIMGILTMFLFTFSSVTMTKQNTFDEEFKKVETSKQLEVLLGKYPNEGTKIIPKLESMIIDEIKNRGIGNRLVIKEIMPHRGTPGKATISMENDCMVVTFEFSGDRCPIVFGGFAGFAVYSESPDVTNKVVIQKEDIKDFFNGQLMEEGRGGSLGGKGSILRFNGKVEIDSHKFINEGDELNRLTFVLIGDVGCVYLRGKGKVILKDEREIKLGY